MSTGLFYYIYFFKSGYNLFCPWRSTISIFRNLKLIMLIQSENIRIQSEYIISRPPERDLN